jgi:hypothetical protein
MESNGIEPSLKEGTTEATCADVSRWLQAALRSGDLTPPSPVLSTHVERCPICQAVLLAVIATEAELPPLMSCVTHRHCLDDLPAYIDYGLEDARAAIRTYPHVWWHLLTCRTCGETYRLTQTMIEGERRGQLPPLPRPRRIALPRIMRLSRDILNRLLAPAPTLGMVARGSGRRPIILAEEDNLQGYAITLSVEPQRDGAWRVIIRAEPPAVGHMLLTLGETSFRTAFDMHGIAVVADVPAPLLLQSDSPDLVVSLALEEEA